MFKSLYSKLAAALLGLLVVSVGVRILVFETMLERPRVLELLTELTVWAAALTLLMGLVVFRVLTRRLRELADAVDAFRSASFAEPVRLARVRSNPGGDEIDRLAYAFEQMSERISSQIKQLEQTDKQRRELLASVSHDLRTPLASMQGYLETLLLKEGSLSPEERRNYLEVAAKSCERLAKLVSNLFELTKLESGQVQAQPEPFPLGELVQDVAQKFSLTAEKKGVRIETDCPRGLPQVRADIGMVERVFENLIENALRHCEPGALVRLTLEPAGGRVVARVSDTGRGIPAEELPKIFERYYRVERHAGDGASAGLGLAITRHIVLLHGGEIRVESQLGVGTSFVFDLPAA